MGMRAEAAHRKGRGEAVPVLRLQMAERVASVCKKGLNKNDVAAEEESGGGGREAGGGECEHES